MSRVMAGLDENYKDERNAWMITTRNRKIHIGVTKFAFRKKPSLYFKEGTVVRPIPITEDMADYIQGVIDDCETTEVAK